MKSLIARLRDAAKEWREHVGDDRVPAPGTFGEVLGELTIEAADELERLQRIEAAVGTMAYFADGTTISPSQLKAVLAESRWPKGEAWWEKEQEPVSA